MLGKLFAKLMGTKEKKKSRTSRPSRAAGDSKKTSAAAKKPAKKRARPSPPKKKPATLKKQPPAQGPQDEIGRVVAFFRIPSVAVVRLKKGTLKMGERIWIRGHTTDLKQVVTSMQINHQPITKARKGDEMGVKVSARARRGDRVYRIPA